MGSFEVPLDDERTQLDAFVEEYRSALEADPRAVSPRSRPASGSSRQRRRCSGCSNTSHGCSECGSRSASAVRPVANSDWRSVLRSPSDIADDDTVASVTAAHRQACATARAAVAALSLDAVVTGHRAGPRTLHWVYLQVLRELAHHCGHADILREQILAG